MEIFEKFNGWNLDALIDCLQKVKEEGLTIDKHTQAGINDRSGNVWVWSEDWQGCVYMNPTSDTDAKWCYSCPECGEEYNFDNYDAMAEYVEKYEKDGQRCRACHEKD